MQKHLSCAVKQWYCTMWSEWRRWCPHLSSRIFTCWTHINLPLTTSRGAITQLINIALPVQTMVNLQTVEQMRAFGQMCTYNIKKHVKYKKYKLNVVCHFFCLLHDTPSWYFETDDHHHSSFLLNSQTTQYQTCPHLSGRILTCWTHLRSTYRHFPASCVEETLGEKKLLVSSWSVLVSVCIWSEDTVTSS